MYEVNSLSVGEAYAAHLSGERSTLACVVSTRPLGAAARTALASSLAALGYGGSPAFVTVEADGSALGERDLFLLLEGLDPLVLVAADAGSARALGTAYRADAPLDASCRLFGRSAVAFRSFEPLLATPESKQKAWALLKQLPRLG